VDEHGHSLLTTAAPSLLQFYHAVCSNYLMYAYKLQPDLCNDTCVELGLWWQWASGYSLIAGSFFTVELLCSGDWR